MQEAKELATDPCTDYTAAPLEDDLFVRLSGLPPSRSYIEMVPQGMALHNPWFPSD